MYTFKTSKQIEEHIKKFYNLETHVYHIHSRRELIIVYYHIGKLCIKKINVDAIYYLKQEDLDDAINEIFISLKSV